MATYVLMTKLNPEINKQLSQRGDIGKRWLEIVRRNCPNVRFISHYAVLGPYDFMDIFEAPNNETAMKVSLITLSEGAVKAESWPAVPYNEFLDLVSDIDHT